MNPLIVTIIIALGTFIIGIFGASWLNQQAMNKRIDDLKTYLDARFDVHPEGATPPFLSERGGIDVLMGTGSNAASPDFVNARFDAVVVRINAVDQRITRLEQRVERIERQLDTVIKPSLPRA